MHKKSCSSLAAARSRGPLGQKPALPFHKLDAGTWLHDRSKGDVYRLLIDSCRLRLDDLKRFEGVDTSGSVYAGDANSLPAFNLFLRLAESRSGLLPPWWVAEDEDGGSAAECIAVGMGKPEDWYSLTFRPEKSEIIGHYGGDEYMPMQMRMFAEQVYGRGVGGADGAGMRRTMMRRESGGLPGTRILSLADL